MSDYKFLTIEEVFERYRRTVAISTLENWRTMGIGPSFMKVGKAVLYPIKELKAWDRQNMVICQSSKVVGRMRITSNNPVV